MQYTFYYYNGQPTRERRMSAYAGEGVELEHINCSTDLDALYYAASTLLYDSIEEDDYSAEEIQDIEKDLNLDTKAGCLDYLDSVDITSGEPYYFAIKDAYDNFIYGDEETIASFMDELSEAFDDDELNEEMASCNESQSQEISSFYRQFQNKTHINLEELIYGTDGFMQECYPQGFPDFDGDIIYSRKYWQEFEDWFENKFDQKLPTL